MHTLSDPEQAAEARAQSRKTPVKLYPCNETTRATVRDMRARDVKLTIATLARKLNCNTAIISQWLSDEGNQYPGTITTYEARAEDFIRNEARRRASGVETISCSVAKQLASALEMIRRTNDIGVIMAEAGFGKTRGEELYAAQNPTAILFRIFSWCCDKASLEGALFKVVGSAGYDNRTKRAEFLTHKLAGSDRLLIVDDAHKLTRPALQWLFDFCDETQIPLGLVGTFTLLDKVEDDPQRGSRVGLRFEIIPEEPRDLIEYLARTLAPGAANGQFIELCDLAEQVVKEDGHYRAAHKQLKLAVEMRELKPALTWPEAFRAAHSLLIRDYTLS